MSQVSRGSQLPSEMGEASTQASILSCPRCGGPCTSTARACPHCDVELATVRCVHCFTLHFCGARFCSRCGKGLELEPVLEKTAAPSPCPRCAHPLAAAALSAIASSPETHECTRCGGMFVGHRELAAMIDERDRAASMPAPSSARASWPPPPSRGSPAGAETTVRYLKCPICAAVMNRMNFGRYSGVIVDVCKQHGTWFDAGELTSTLEFVAAGGLIETRRREHDEAAQKAREHPGVFQARVEAEVAMIEGARHTGIRSDDWGHTGSSLMELLARLFR